MLAIIAKMKLKESAGSDFDAGPSSFKAAPKSEKLFRDNKEHLKTAGHQSSRVGLGSAKPRNY